MSGGFVARLLKEAQLEHEKNLGRQKQILLMQAESKQLPEFLGLIGIGLLLECDPDAFVEFIESQPVAIEIRDDQEGIARDEFKRYRQSVGLWPVKDCPLANWWPESENTRRQSANSEIPDYLDPTHPMHSQELAIAIECWNQVFAGNPPKPKRGSRKNLAEDWLNEHYPNLAKETKKRIAIMLNPDKNGGAPSSS